MIDDAGLRHWRTADRIAAKSRAGIPESTPDTKSERMFLGALCWMSVVLGGMTTRDFGRQYGLSANALSAARMRASELELAYPAEGFALEVDD